MKLKVLPKKHIVQKIYKVDIVKELFLASWSSSKLLEAFWDNLAFCRHSLSDLQNWIWCF